MYVYMYVHIDVCMHTYMYVLQVDKKAPNSVKKAVQSIAGCFDNVFLASEAVSVYWGHISLVRAELACLKDLSKSPSWKYYINLTGREFPLRTNKELVDILRALNGSNDISGTSNRYIEERLTENNRKC